jgi:hypothetical protein
MILTLDDCVDGTLRIVGIGTIWLIFMELSMNIVPQEATSFVHFNQHGGHTHYHHLIQSHAIFYGNSSSQEGCLK